MPHETAAVYNETVGSTKKGADASLQSGFFVPL